MKTRIVGEHISEVIKYVPSGRVAIINEGGTVVDIVGMDNLPATRKYFEVMGSYLIQRPANGSWDCVEYQCRKAGLHIPYKRKQTKNEPSIKTGLQSPESKIPQAGHSDDAKYPEAIAWAYS